MKKRTWLYVMPPEAYEISCDLCGGNDLAWSEFESRVYCFDCKQDVSGTGGILEGPVPIELIQMLGISLDRFVIGTGERLYMREDNGKLVWESRK